jgi:hypothetical protein
MSYFSNNSWIVWIFVGRPFDLASWITTTDSNLPITYAYPWNWFVDCNCKCMKINDRYTSQISGVIATTRYSFIYN